MRATLTESDKFAFFRRYKKSTPREKLNLWLTIIGWTFVIVFTLLAVAPGLLPSKVFLGTSLLQKVAPWSVADDPNLGVNLGISDTIDSATPMLLLIVKALHAGHFPLWDPYTNGGTELAALPNSAILSPVSWPWLVLPSTAANAGTKIAEIVVIAVGMQLLLVKQWKLPSLTAPLATMVYVSSGFMIAWTNWPQTRVASYIPLLFWAIDRAAVKTSWKNFIPLSIVFASMLLGGFPAVVAYAFYPGAVYFFVRLLTQKFTAKQVWKNIGHTIIGLCAGVGLAAVQIVPFAYFMRNYVDMSERANYGQIPLPSETLSSTVIPYLFGYPNGTNFSWPVHYIESFSYLGDVTLVLLLVALLMNGKRKLPTGVFAFLVASFLLLNWGIYFGGYPLKILAKLPGISSSPIYRMRCMLGFLAALISAYGLAIVFEPKGLQLSISALRKFSYSAALRALLRGGSALLICVVLYTQIVASQNAKLIYFSHMWTVVAAAIVALTALACFMVYLSPKLSLSSFTVFLCLVLTVVPATNIAKNWWPISDASTFYQTTSAHEFLTQNLGESRYITVGQTMMPGTSTAYGLRALSGHSFSSPEWRSTVEEIDPAIYYTATYVSLPSGSLANADMTSGVLDRYAGKYAVAAVNEKFNGTLEPTDASSSTVTLHAGDSITSDTKTGPVRGLQLVASDYSGLSDDNAALNVSIISDADGSTLAQAQMRLAGGIPNDGIVPIPGEDIPAGTSWHAQVSISETASYITFALTDTGNLAVGCYRPVADGLKLVHAGDALIFERESALPRVRWASTAELIEDPTQRADTLQSGKVPADTVVLENSADVEKTTASSSASVTEKDISTDEIEITAKADGAGWVVVADPLRDGGWSATLNGSSTKLIMAENAGVAVYVPAAGEYTITLNYSAPGWNQGVLISWVTWGAIFGALGFSQLRKRRARQQHKPVAA